MSRAWITYLKFPDSEENSAKAYPVEVRLGHTKGIVSSSDSSYNFPSRFAFKVTLRCKASESAARGDDCNFDDCASGDVEVAETWEAVLIFKAFHLTQLDIVGNAINNDSAQVEEDRRKGEDRGRKSDGHIHHHNHNPPPLVFPRSVSPYICRRSDDSSWHNQVHDRRFYSTPQVGPTFSKNYDNGKRRSRKFSLFSTLFRSSRSEQSSASSSSWFSSLLSGRRKKNSRFDQRANVFPRCRRDRGMSPTNVEEQRDFETEDIETESGYSSVATATPARRKGSVLHNRNVSGLAFCMSPLVRASPNNHRKDVNLPTSGFSGEISRKNVSGKCHLSTAASLCANRSRKLADFGRYNYNP
ncbi:hypothetical protein IFM89_033243 [Coptis chinensis]|uniref:Uncharacterized protein n=1 Tax=Coptis chinensis TaxID=261450 RepID=A0A835MGL9_9MAGN|nr:hypothetical protein IFM89_033243 [Coptis chinensis]